MRLLQDKGMREILLLMFAKLLYSMVLTQELAALSTQLHQALEAMRVILALLLERSLSLMAHSSTTLLALKAMPEMFEFKPASPSL